MNICFDSKFVELDNDIKDNIIKNKRSKFMEEVKFFLDNGLPKNTQVYSVDFLLNNFIYSESMFPFKIYIQDIDEKVITNMVEWIGTKWSKFVVCKTIMKNLEYSFLVNGIRVFELIKDTPTIDNYYYLLEITKKLYSPFPELYAENIKNFKRMKIDSKIPNIDQSQTLKYEIEKFIIKNLKYIDMGLIVSMDEMYISTFGIGFMGGVEIENKLFLLIRTFLDNKNIEKKITITLDTVKYDLFQSCTRYTVDFNDGVSFEIIKTYNNLEFEPIAYNISNNCVFGMTSLHLALYELHRIVCDKRISDVTKSQKKKVVDFLCSGSDILKFCDAPEFILRFNFVGVYKDLKMERRKLMSNEYVYGERLVHTFIK
jgi:hypothetical protein